MPWARLRSVSATSLSSPTAAPNAASAASRRLCARSIPTKRPSSHSYRPVPMRSPLRGTFMSSAQPASSLLPSRWQRANGRCLTRLRWETRPLTIEGVLSSRMVSYPFTVRDCCLVTDGGGAIVVTSVERAKSLKKAPTYVLGCGQSVTHASISSMPDLTVTGALTAGKAAYVMAKLGPADINAVELYDAFTINTILFLEDLGFCKKGEGGAFVSGGRIGPNGSLAVNTNGGGLSYCHPGMYGLFLLIEAVRQLRGECGARQVKNCEVALAHVGRIVRASVSAHSVPCRVRRSARRKSHVPPARPAVADGCDRACPQRPGPGKRSPGDPG